MKIQKAQRRPNVKREASLQRFLSKFEQKSFFNQN